MKTPPLLPRLALRMLLPFEPREAIVGDLDEEFRARLADPSARRGLTRWYWTMAARSLLSFWNPLRWWRPRVGERARDVRFDARFAVRGWARAPGASLVIALTLALGIGVTTAVFSMADAVLLRPVAGVHDPDALVVVKFERDDGNGTGVSWPNAADLRGAAPGLAGLAGFQSLAANVRAERGAPGSARGEAVAGDYFATLGVRARLGRLPTSAELEDAAPPAVVVLSEPYWRNAFGEDPGALGSSLEINGTGFTIIGVTDRYRGTLRTASVDFFVPMGLYPRLRHFGPEASSHDRASRYLFQLVGRLAPGDDPGVVQQRLRGVMARLVEAHPDANEIHGDYVPTVYEGIGLSTWDQGRTALAMGILGIVVGLVLLIACANVASVLVARAVMRRGETAVRRALGASRARLTRQLLTESVVLALPGGILGLAVAAGVLELLVRLPSAPMAGVSFATLDARVVAFTLMTTLATGLVFGLLPALLVGRDETVGGLAQASGRETRGVGRVRNGLTVLQIALSMTLLVGALLLVRTLHSLASVDLGFDPALLTVHSLPTDRQGYPDQESHRFAERLAEDVRGAPGIEAAALTAVPPFGGSTISTLLRPDDEPEREPLRPLAMWVSEGFLEAMGQRVVRGRTFTPDELALEEDQDPTAVLVNETLARELFGDAPALGRRVVQPLYGGTIASTIVGVVTDARVRSLEAREPIVYLPYRARWGGHVVLLVRSGRPVEEVRAVVQDAAGAIDPAIPLASSESLQSAFERATAEERLFATLLTLTALLAATLAAVGLYGVVAHAVARRRREFGIRLAVGAAGGRLMRRVVGGSLALGGMGVTLGWGGSWLFSRLLESRLHGVDAFDPPTFLAAGALLLVLTGLASLSPALAATRVDPSEALRSE